MKILIVYYSKTGNNAYLAKLIAKNNAYDIERIKPRVSAFPLLLLSSALKKGFGNKPMQSRFTDYDKVILCGPIWMGTVVAPLRAFLLKYGNEIRQLHFITCCGGSDEQKEDKFGYATVFAKLAAITGNNLVSTAALPITLVIAPEANRDEAALKTRLTDDNFTGEIAARLDGFLKRVMK